jgi:hypothetical protein
MGPRRALSSRSPGHLVPVGAAAATLFLASAPGGDDSFFLGLVWVPSACVWLAWMLWRSGGLKDGARVDGRSIVAWLVGPALAVLALTFAVLGLPLAARFALSRAAFEADARAALAASGPQQTPRPAYWLGLYRVRRSVESGEVWYSVSGAGGVFGWGGFGYSPPGVAREDPWGRRDLGGGWFVWLRTT